MRSEFLLALTLATTPLFADTESPEARVDTLLSEFHESAPGVVIGIVREGELVFARADGMADLRFGIPFEIDTPTNIGSTAKQFTGLALALLHARGELSLDDDVRDYIPELPDFGETVTLRHLASHTSGYREYLNTLVLGGVRVLKGDWVGPGDALAVVLGQPELQNTPGEEWNYNNTGYTLIARVIAKVTGKPFDEWLGEEVFAPLGMTDTRVRGGPDRILPGASTGYRKVDEDYFEARDVGGAFGDGGVYTTVADMARWMRQLAAFELGGDEVRKLMTTPFTLVGGESANYGLGLFIDQWRGLKRWQHGGGDAGHLSVFNYFPEIDAGYMIFANHHDVSAELITGLPEIFFGEHLEAPESGEPDAPAADTVTEPSTFSDKLFDRYAGRYELEAAPGFVLRFFRDGERYMTQATGQPAVEITPVAADTFKLESVEARVVFHVGEDGRAEALTLFQNGEHRAVRLPDEDEEQLELGEYAGRYFSAELETFYTIEAGDGELLLHIRRFEPVALQHAGKDRFSGSFPVFSVDFERNEEGRVAAFRAGNVRARDIRFERVD